MRILVVLSLVVFSASSEAGILFGRRQQRYSPPAAAKVVAPVAVTPEPALLASEVKQPIKGSDGRFYLVRSHYASEKSQAPIKRLGSAIESVWNETTQTWDAFPEDKTQPLKRVEKGEDGRWYTVRYYREGEEVRREVFSVWTAEEKWQRLLPLTGTVISIQNPEVDKSALDIPKATEKLKEMSSDVKTREQEIQALAPNPAVLAYRNSAVAHAIARGVPVPRIRAKNEILALSKLNQGPTPLGSMVVDHVEAAERVGTETPTLVLRVSQDSRDEVKKTVADFRASMVSAVVRSKSNSAISGLIGALTGESGLAEFGKLPVMNLRVVVDASKDVEDGYQSYAQKMKSVPAIAGAVAAHTGFTTKGKDTSRAEKRLARGGALLASVQAKIDAGIASAIAQVNANPRTQNAEKTASEYLAARLAEGIQKAVIEIASSNGDTFTQDQISLGVVTQAETSRYLSNLLGSGNMGMEFTLQGGERVYFPYEKGGSIKEWAYAVTKLMTLGQTKKLTEDDVTVVQKEYLRSLAALEPRLEIRASKSHR